MLNQQKMILIEKRIKGHPLFSYSIEKDEVKELFFEKGVIKIEKIFHPSEPRVKGFLINYGNIQFMTRLNTMPPYNDFFREPPGITIIFDRWIECEAFTFKLAFESFEAVVFSGFATKINGRIFSLQSLQEVKNEEKTSSQQQRQENDKDRNTPE